MSLQIPRKWLVHKLTIHLAVYPLKNHSRNIFRRAAINPMFISACSHPVEMDTRCPNPSSPIRPLSSFLDMDTLVKCSEAVHGAMVNRWRRMAAASGRHSYSGLTIGSGTPSRMTLKSPSVIICYAMILAIVQYVIATLIQVKRTCVMSWEEIKTPQCAINIVDYSLFIESK